LFKKYIKSTPIKGVTSTS